MESTAAARSGQRSLNDLYARGMDEPTPPRSRADQRRGTEARILAAARDRFAESGYQRTTIRSVAALAGVDPGLVMHYFGSKAGLFSRAAAAAGPALPEGTAEE